MGKDFGGSPVRHPFDLSGFVNRRGVIFPRGILSLPNIPSDAKATRSRLISTEMGQVCAVIERANILGVARSSGRLSFEAGTYLRMQTAD